MTGLHYSNQDSPDTRRDAAVNAQLTALKAALRSDLAVLGEQVELAAQHLAVPKAGDPTQAEANVQVCMC
jgi:hypothetical protein